MPPLNKDQAINVARTLRNHMEMLEEYFHEAPIDYQDRGDGLEELIEDILINPKDI